MLCLEGCDSGAYVAEMDDFGKTARLREAIHDCGTGKERKKEGEGEKEGAVDAIVRLLAYI